MTPSTTPENLDEPRRSPDLRHRMDAVTRLLQGQDTADLAQEMGVSPREIELWAKEFCRAGEIRLRQLPDNWVERCLTSTEKLVPLATLISVLIAVTLFVQGERKQAADRARQEALQRESRVREAYASLDDKYLDYLKLCLDHPDLDVFDTPLVRTFPPTVDQQRREAMVLSILLSILERAYLMYSEPGDAFELNQWAAWSSYMRAWANRPNFQAELKDSQTEFDANFVRYLQGLIPARAATMP